jgi:adenine-specific DNA-methyltransferase
MDFEDMSKEELIEYINNLNEEQSGKYGLVWDAEKVPEQIVTECNKLIPILKEEESKKIDNGGEDNILIEGDNFHSLSVLNYTHEGAIDVIYIDPPYNTGNEDFIYNDNFVDREDGYRHSKWLNFMDKRLKLAKNLMSKNGVMFISIDDNEAIQLKMLCNKIFGENNTDIMIWRKSGVGRDGKMKNTTTFRKDHEYIVVCYKGERVLNKIIETPNFVNTYPNLDKDPRGPYKAGSISRTEEASNPSHKNYYTVTTPSGKKITRQFDISKEEFEQLNSDVVMNEDGKFVSRIYWGKNDDAVPSIKTFINELRSITPYSMLLSKGTTTDGTKELNNILNGDYTAMRPKPSLLIKTLVQLASNKDSIVLDFFAGSGTTGQAVMELNKEDDGHRKFILCTNNEVSEKIQKEFKKNNNLTDCEFIKIKKSDNKEWKKCVEENGICSSITYPRIEKIIHGYDYNDKSITVLMNKPLSFSDFTNNNEVLQKEIQKILDDNKEKYDNIEKKINDNSLIISGVNKKGSHYDGLHGTLKYFKTEFVKNNSTRDQIYYDLTEKCIPMLCVKGSTFDLVEKTNSYVIYKDKYGLNYTCIYFDILNDNYNEFLKKIKDIKNDKALYIFSLNNRVDEYELDGITNYKIETIPQKIYDLYRKLVKLSKEN